MNDSAYAPDHPMPVTFERIADCAVVTIDNPPVNAIGRAERAGLLAATERAAAEPGLRGVVLQGRGRTFAAGADTREFDSDPEPPHLPDVIAAIERSPVPWIAAIAGPALGGGCEIALGCRRRIAGPGATIGLPEVTLGVVPGAGGTQRLPRLVGFATALDVIAEGKVVAASQALQLGLVDALVDDPLAVALTELSDAGSPEGTALSDRPAPTHDAAAEAAARARAKTRCAGQVAPARAIDLVCAATSHSFAEGLAAERAAFLELRGGRQARALRHLFYAERGARAPKALAAEPPREIRQVGVVGGGTMGAGIAYALFRAGMAVKIVEADVAAASRANENLGRLFDDAVRRGLMQMDSATAGRAAVPIGTDYAAFADVDLVIEAAFEHFAAKRTIFAALDAVVPDGAVLATNTSYLDVDAIAACTRRPADVLGLHFFSPAHVMRLLEIVRGAATSKATLAAGFALAARLKKIPVVAGVCDGFIGNRILARYRDVADNILLEGGLPWEVDDAMVTFGYPMGPYAAQDVAGLDIAYANRKRLAPTRDPRRRYVTIQDRMVEEGRLGRKASVGWYRYPGGSGAVIDPLLEDLIAEESHFAGVKRRPFSPDEIRHRLLLAMIDEAAAILHEGIAETATAIDLVTVHGYGFPRWRGGLMHYASTLGFDRVLRDVEALSTEDPVLWAASPGLRKLAEAA